MIGRLSADVRRLVLTAATEEAQRRGDRRLGTDHFLLGLLHDEGSPVTRALGLDLEKARTAADALDREALSAIGFEAGPLGPFSGSLRARRSRPLTSGARAVFKQTIDQARATKSGRIEASHFLLALLTRKRPDPAAELLFALGVDAGTVRERLDSLAGGG